MVQIAPTLIATTLFAGSVLARGGGGQGSSHHYRRDSFAQDEVLGREVPELGSREDIKMMLQRSLDVADELDERDPFFGLIAAAVRIGTTAARAARAGRAIHKGVKAGHKVHKANEHRKNRKHRRDLEEREINGEFYNELD
ncbi:hypothetical protein CPB83DRAFT_854007 [Crepidotus variabilis]|uniref:Uncharacterized protein n=1 Tax=Crepidotus variabilis TaxID=179855 RepID=A0A9P6EFL1_9AGAR|nr:hypothetical protein CPB83DRAFT_854007 [Crepidotus variabilis]